MAVPRSVLVTGYGRTFNFDLNADNSLSMTTFKSGFPGACGLSYKNGNEEISTVITTNGTLFFEPPGGWDKKTLTPIYETYPTKLIPSGSKRPHIEDDTVAAKMKQENDIVQDKCQKYMLRFQCEKNQDGDYVETGVENCAVVASENCAFTAAHCISDEFPFQQEITLKDADQKSYVANLIVVRRMNETGDDFAILKLKEGTFPHVPNGMAFPSDGSRYFVLGIDGDYPQAARFSCFSATFRNTTINALKNFVIGSPGTTGGCSGGGVFDRFGQLYGICVAGKIKLSSTKENLPLVGHYNQITSKLAEPSYSHIVPAIYIKAYW